LLPIVLNIERENRDVAAAFATIVEQHAGAILGSGAVLLLPTGAQIISLAGVIRWIRKASGVSSRARG
jgi:hypothetical protein